MRNPTGSSTDAVIYCKKNDDDLELICCIFVIILIDMKEKGRRKMKCIKCGADLPDGSVFCTNCGAKLDAGQPAQAPSQPQASAQPVAGR